MKFMDRLEMFSTDDKIGSFKLIYLILDNTLVKVCLVAMNFFLAWILNGSQIGGFFGLIGIAFLIVALLVTEVFLLLVAGVAEISAEIIADCIAPRPDGSGITSCSTNAPKKERIQFTERTFRNLISAWTLRPQPVSRIDDYLCLGISEAVSEYATQQMIRDIHVYEAEIQMLWFINLHLILQEHEDVLGRGKSVRRRAFRWMYKNFAEEMRPFLNFDMDTHFNIFRRDVQKLRDQRVAKNHPCQTEHECCIDIFESRYNRKGDPETTQNLMGCILKTLEYADAI